MRLICLVLGMLIFGFHGLKSQGLQADDIIRVTDAKDLDRVEAILLRKKFTIYEASQAIDSSKFDFITYSDNRNFLKYRYHYGENIQKKQDTVRIVEYVSGSLDIFYSFPKRLKQLGFVPEGQIVINDQVFKEFERKKPYLFIRIRLMKIDDKQMVNVRAFSHWEYTLTDVLPQR